MGGAFDPSRGQRGGLSEAGPTMLGMEDVRVASVAVDVPLANLDRPFDYLVPDELAEAAVVGARVRVRFAGRLRNGFILELRTDSARDKLLPLQGGAVAGAGADR